MPLQRLLLGAARFEGHEVVEVAVVDRLQTVFGQHSALDEAREQTGLGEGAQEVLVLQMRLRLDELLEVEELFGAETACEHLVFSEAPLVVVQQVEHCLEEALADLPVVELQRVVFSLDESVELFARQLRLLREVLFVVRPCELLEALLQPRGELGRQLSEARFCAVLDDRVSVETEDGFVSQVHLREVVQRELLCLEEVDHRHGALEELVVRLVALHYARPPGSSAAPT